MQRIAPLAEALAVVGPEKATATETPVIPPSTAFDHPAAGKEVGLLSCKLSQGIRSAAEYALDYRTHAAGSGWSAPALKTVFQRGLQADHQMELVFCCKEMTLDQLIDTAISLDNLIRGKRKL